MKILKTVNKFYLESVATVQPSKKLFTHLLSEFVIFSYPRHSTYSTSLACLETH